MREIQLRDAKATLSAVVDDAMRGKPSVITRHGRREAVVRMKQQARAQGATMIFNVRFETASLSEDRGGQQTAFSAEFIAYGTALVPVAGAR